MKRVYWTIYWFVCKFNTVFIVLINEMKHNQSYSLSSRGKIEDQYEICWTVFMYLRYVLTSINEILINLRRYNEETKFPVTPSFVLTHSSDSITVQY